MMLFGLIGVDVAMLKLVVCPSCGKEWFTKSISEYISCGVCHIAFKNPQGGDH